MYAFRNLHEDTCFQIYSLLVKYKTLLQIEDSYLEELKSIIQDKLSVSVVYILNPSLEDLLLDNIYKLTIDDDIYFVPLWHHEVYFEQVKSDKDIVVKCIPTHHDDTYICENNDLYIKKTLTQEEFANLLSEDNFRVNIGSQSREIATHTISMTKNQTVKIPKQGISRLNESNLYDTSERGDIYVNIIVES